MLSSLALAALLATIPPAPANGDRHFLVADLPSPDVACPVGVCGRGKPRKASDRNFDERVLEADAPVLVDFTAPWCAPCRRLEPTLKELAAERAEDIKVVTIQVAKNGELAERYGVRWVPTLLLFYDGELVDRRTGALRRPTLERWIESSVPEAFGGVAVARADQRTGSATGASAPAGTE